MNQITTKQKLLLFSVILISLGFLNTAWAKLDYFGYYFVEDHDLNLHYLPELKGYANLTEIKVNSFDWADIDQDQSNRVKNAGFKIILAIPVDSESVFTNANGVRDTYLQNIKNRVSRDTDLISSVVGIEIHEEYYTLLKQGYFDSWSVFQGLTFDQKIVKMKQELEGFISEVKKYFPGIPVLMVDNDWHLWPVDPPSNVDILGIDAYYIPTTPQCDSTQRSKFEAEVLPAYNGVLKYGKPLLMVPPSFNGSIWKILSTCQMQWYYDLAKSMPSIIGMKWFFYAANVDGMSGIVNFPTQLAYLKQMGQEVLGYATPLPSPVPAPSCAISFSPATVDAGKNSTVTWSSSNDADGFLLYSCGSMGSGTIPANGSTTVTPASTQTCTLTATNSASISGSCSATVTVGPVCFGNCAKFISQNVPTTMVPGQSYPVSITINNIGTTTWTAQDGYKLGSQNPENNITWGVNRVGVPNTVLPGQEITFSGNIRAPINAGLYNFQWRMLRELVQWFGDYTPNVSVKVENSVAGSLLDNRIVLNIFQFIKDSFLNLRKGVWYAREL